MECAKHHTLSKTTYALRGYPAGVTECRFLGPENALILEAMAGGRGKNTKTCFKSQKNLDRSYLLF